MEFLKATTSQLKTMSKESAAILPNIPVFHVTAEEASDEYIINVRQGFAQQEAGELDEMKARFNPTIEEHDIKGVHVFEITPQNINPTLKDKVIYYIHGGGYVMGSATDRTGMLMTNELGIKAFAIDYKLAPEHKYPVALNESFEVYKWLINQYGAKNITIISTSAGSTHHLSTLLKAQEENLPMINSNVLLSPSVDLSDAGDSWVANEHRDVLKWNNQFDVLYAKPFLGNADQNNPLVSPVYGDFKKTYPATFINTGTRDAFLSGSSRLYWNLRNAGVETEMTCHEGMWHAFTNFPDVPEAIEARKAAQEFILKQFNKADEEAMKQLVIDFEEEVVNGGKIELLDQYCHDDFVWRGGSLGEYNGLEEYKEFAEANVGGAFTEMHLEIISLAVDGNTVIARFTNSGLNSGEFMGKPASNKHAKWNGIGYYTIENGKFKNAFFVEDIMSMLAQLGL